MSQPQTSPNAAPATQNDSPKFRTNFSKTADAAPATKSDT